MHRLLKRQIKKHLPDQFQTDAVFTDFFEAVDQAYDQAKEDRELLEQSLELSSKELREKNLSLKQQVTQLNEVKQELEQVNAIMSSTLESVDEGIIVMNIKGELIMYNQKLLKLIRLEADQLNQCTLATIINHIHAQVKNKEKPEDQISFPKKNEPQHFVEIIEFKNGTVLQHYSTPHLIQGSVAGLLWSFRDITQLHLREKTIYFQAHHDALTKLPNRLLCNDRLYHAIEKAKRYNLLLATLYLDLDQFKNINDTLGHHAGDALLKTVAQRLQNCIRSGDTVARLGGDEFVLIIEEFTSLGELHIITKRIIESLKAPIQIENQEFYTTASIGIALYPNDSEVPETLLRKADMAMYVAKNKGKNNYTFFEPQLEEQALKRINLEKNLRNAIKQNQFYLLYQPKVSMDLKTIKGVEALIRWQLPNGKEIYPNDFIPLAEETGLIIDIGTWVIHECSRQLKAWSQQGINNLIAAVNISPRQLQQADIKELVLSAVKEHQLPTQYFELEITENLIMNDIEQSINVLNKIHEQGIRIAVDDFGTGHSSLNYLKKLPIDELKIDQSFIMDLNKSKQDEAITKSIITLGHNLDLEVTAEGVEDQKTLDFLHQNQCDKIQGYFFSKPVTANEFAKLYQSLLGAKP